MSGYRILLNFLTVAEQEELSEFIESLEWADQQGDGYLKQAVPTGKFEEIKKRSEEVLGSDGTAIGDCHVIRYPVHSYIPPHLDPTKIGFEHLRINAIIQAPEDGGVFGIESRNVDLLEGDAVVFRADTLRHRITTVNGKRERYVWSVGVLKPKETNNG